MDTVKRTKINIIGVSETKEGERDRSLFKEIMAKLGRNRHPDTDSSKG